MAKLFDLEKEDSHFVESTLNLEKRRPLIKRLETTRKFSLVLLWGSLILFALAVFFPGDSSRDASDVMVSVLFMILFYYLIDARIKLLKIVDRMDSSEK